MPDENNAPTGADKGTEGAAGDPKATAGQGTDPGQQAAGQGTDTGKGTTEGQAGKTTGEPGKGEGGEPKSPWPDGWHKHAMTGIEDKDGKVLTKLQRYASVPDLAKAAISGQSKIDELTGQIKGMVKVPGKDAKPEEIAAYRKAVGVPEKADQYVYERPKDAPAETELDKQIDQVAREEALKAGYTLEQFRTGKALIDRMNSMAAQQLDQNAKKARDATEDALRVKYGADYRTNIELANRYISTKLGENGKELLQMRLSDGTRLGDYQPLLELFVEEGRASADHGALEVGDTQQGVDIEKKIDEIIALSNKNPDEYKKRQDELTRLVAIQQRRRAA